MIPDNRYASFMLRFQWTKSDKKPIWIVSMQSTKTGELCWYPSLEALISFLREEFGAYEGRIDTACERATGGSSEKKDLGDNLQ